MLVMILEKAPASLRGKLSRWLIEPRTGVYLGNPSARVRDRLWMKTTEKIKDGYALQIWSDSGVPQGYRYRSTGRGNRVMVDMEGIALVLKPDRVSKSRKKEHKK